MPVSESPLDKFKAGLAAALLDTAAGIMRDHLPRAAGGTPQRPTDRFRPLMHFLSGLLAASLALIIALFSAFLTAETATALRINGLVAASLAAVLGSSVVTTISITAAQWLKSESDGRHGPPAWLFALPCAVAVAAMAFIGLAAWQVATEIRITPPQPAPITGSRTP